MTTNKDHRPYLRPIGPHSDLDQARVKGFEIHKLMKVVKGEQEPTMNINPRVVVAVLFAVVLLILAIGLLTPS